MPARAGTILIFASLTIPVHHVDDKGLPEITPLYSPVVRFFRQALYIDNASGMSEFEDMRERDSSRVRRLRETCLRLRLGKADDVGGVAEEGEGVQGMGLVGEFFAGAEFPVVD